MLCEEGVSPRTRRIQGGLMILAHKLHLTTFNRRHLIILAIVPMSCQGGPFFQTLDMVKHYPRILHVTFDLHTLLGRFTDIVKTNILSLKWPRNLLPWTYLKLEWSLSAIILSIVPISLWTKCFETNTKSRQFGEAKVVKLSMTTSRNKHARWRPSRFDGDFSK